MLSHSQVFYHIEEELLICYNLYIYFNTFKFFLFKFFGLRSLHSFEETQRSILWRKHEHVYYSLMADILFNLIMQNCAGNSCYLIYSCYHDPSKKKQKNKTKQKREKNDLLQCSDKTEKLRKCSYLEKHILFSTFCSIDLYICLYISWKKEWCFDYYSLDELCILRDSTIVWS